MRTQLKRWQSYILPSALLVATMAFSGTASAQFGFRSGVRLFTGANFTGQSVTLRGDTPSLVPLGINDRVESIQIPNGQEWEVCVDIDYGNQCQVLQGSVADLNSIGWGGRISSLRRLSGSYASNRRYDGAVGTSGVISGATVYTDPNFRGQAYTLRGAMPDLVPSGLNDKISSIQIPDGEAWEVCTDVEYGNGCQVLTGSISDLRSMGWNDRISSLRPVSGSRYGAYRRNDSVYDDNVYNNGSVYNNGAQGLVFFGRTGFRGASRTVSGGSTNVGWAARSIQVRDNRPWQVCDSTGECVTITRDVPDVSELGLNGRITSVRPLNNSRSRFFRR